MIGRISDEHNLSDARLQLETAWKEWIEHASFRERKEAAAEQAFCSDRGLRRLGFQAFGQSQVLVCTPPRWLANAIRICNKPKHEATNQNSAQFRRIKKEFRKSFDEF
jgi:hypothetical protein